MNVQITAINSALVKLALTALPVFLEIAGLYLHKINFTLLLEQNKRLFQPTLK
jgi:hypothetical protein